MLYRKLLRTMGEYKAQFISMVVMVVLGMGVFVGFNMEWYTIETDVSEFFEDTGFADYRLVDETGFSLEDVVILSLGAEGLTDIRSFLIPSFVLMWRMKVYLSGWNTLSIRAPLSSLSSSSVKSAVVIPSRAIILLPEPGNCRCSARGR